MIANPKPVKTLDMIGSGIAPKNNNYTRDNERILLSFMRVEEAPSLLLHIMVEMCIIV